MNSNPTQQKRKGEEDIPTLTPQRKSTHIINVDANLILKLPQHISHLIRQWQKAYDPVGSRQTSRNCVPRCSALWRMRGRNDYQPSF